MPNLESRRNVSCVRKPDGGERRGGFSVRARALRCMEAFCRFHRTARAVTLKKGKATESCSVRAQALRYDKSAADAATCFMFVNRTARAVTLQSSWLWGRAVPAKRLLGLRNFLTCSVAECGTIDYISGAVESKRSCDSKGRPEGGPRR